MTVSYIENAALRLVEGFYENGVEYALSPGLPLSMKKSLLYDLDNMIYSCESDAGIRSIGTIVKVGPRPEKSVKSVDLIEQSPLKDSGERSKFITGAVRDVQTDKGRFDLLPSYAIRRLAKHFEKGSKKYGDRNWEKGIPLPRYIDSGLRHLFAVLDGQQDEDHIAAALWNITCYIETEERIRRGVLPATLAEGLPIPGQLHQNPKEPT